MTWCMYVCMYINLYHYIEAFYLSFQKQNANCEYVRVLIAHCKHMINGIKANCCMLLFHARVLFVCWILSFFSSFFLIILPFCSHFFSLQPFIHSNVPFVFSRMSFIWTRHFDENLSKNYVISFGGYQTQLVFFRSLSPYLFFFLSLSVKFFAVFLRFVWLLIVHFHGTKL